MKKLLLPLLGALIALPTLARDFQYTYEGQTINYTVIDEEAKTCKTKESYTSIYVAGLFPGNRVEGDLILPSNPKDEDTEFTLIAVGKGSFDDNSGLTSISIPNSVTKIGYEAFYGCTGLSKAEFQSIEHLCSMKFDGAFTNPLMFAHNLYIKGELLTSVIIPESVTEIGNSAFYGCSGLTSINIPNSVTRIGSYAFSDCSGLTAVSIPNSVTEIGEGAFSDCSSLTSINIPNSVTEIDEGVFNNCSGLTSVIIPASVTSIGAMAFCYCSGLTSINIPESVSKIGKSAFAACTGLTSFIIPNSITALHAGVFNSCSGLTSVTIPNSIIYIGEGVFYGCSSLTSVTIPNSVKGIYSEAFRGCTGMHSVTIPNSVTKISYDAFRDCIGLTSVTYLAEEPVAFESDIFDEETYQKATLNYLKSAEEKIASTSPWSHFINRIGRDADYKEEGAISEVQATDGAATTVYDMRGVKVGTSTSGLQRGIYIANGRKIFVR